MRSFSDPSSWDDDLFEVDEAKRRRRAREDALAANAEIAAAEARAEVVRRERATAVAMETNRRQVLREYEAAGVEPIAVDAAGKPVVSLSLLLSLGWTVERIGDRNVLARPATRREGDA